MGKSIITALILAQLLFSSSCSVGMGVTLYNHYCREEESQEEYFQKEREEKQNEKKPPYCVFD